MECAKKGFLTAEQGIIILVLLAFLIVMIIISIKLPQGKLFGMSLPIGGP